MRLEEGTLTTASRELEAYQALKAACNLLLKCKNQGSTRYYWVNDVTKVLDQLFSTLTVEEQAEVLEVANVKT